MARKLIINNITNNYVPSLTVSKVPSKGLCTREPGWDSGRANQLLSRLERKVFLILDWVSITNNIREQYGLPLNETLRIASDLNIRHPGIINKDGIWVPKQMSTDFVFDCQHEDGFATIALFVKQIKDITKRTIQKFTIERTYWGNKNVIMYCITDYNINNVLFENIKWVHKYKQIDDCYHIGCDIKFINSKLFDSIINNKNTPLKHITTSVDNDLYLEPGTSLGLVRHFIANRSWHVDMITDILSPARPLPLYSNDIADNHMSGNNLLLKWL